MLSFSWKFNSLGSKGESNDREMHFFCLIFEDQEWILNFYFNNAEETIKIKRFND